MSDLHHAQVAVPHLVINGFKNVLAIAIGTEYSFPQADKVTCHMPHAERSRAFLQKYCCSVRIVCRVSSHTQPACSPWQVDVWERPLVPGPYHLFHVDCPQIKEILENPELLAAATAASSAPAAGGGDAKEEESAAKKEESEEEEEEVSPPPSLQCHVHRSATLLSAHCSAVRCLKCLTM